MTDMLPLEALPHTSVDEKTADLLQLMSGDPIHAGDRRRITHAIVADANANAGKVDLNRVRARLTDPAGNLTVYPRVVGATIQTLTRRGALRPMGWVTCNGSTSGNNGKPQRAYRLVDRSPMPELSIENGHDS